VGEEIRRFLAGIFQEEEFWYPQLADNAFVITEVCMSADLGPLLKAEKHAIRKILAQKIQLRYARFGFYSR
jgi:ribosome-binding factor A